MHSEYKGQRLAWTQRLSEDDLAFVKRFLLASGSLKQIASEYGVSYPTVRLRLDRLIEKIRIYDSTDTGDEMEKLLSVLYAEGKLNSETFRQIRTTYQSQKEETDETQTS